MALVDTCRWFVIPGLNRDSAGRRQDVPILFFVDIAMICIGYLERGLEGLFLQGIKMVIHFKARA
jgi:hypothetical protein